MDIKSTKMYRVEGKITSNIDEFDNVIGFNYYVYFKVYNVIKTTMKGMWIQSENGFVNRFMLSSARKKFACFTKKEAIESFIIRKNIYIGILKDRIHEAQTFISYANMLEKE